MITKDASVLIVRTIPSQMPFLSTIVTSSTPSAAISPTTAAKFRTTTTTNTSAAASLITIPRQMTRPAAIVALYSSTATATIVAAAAASTIVAAAASAGPPSSRATKPSAIASVATAASPRPTGPGPSASATARPGRTGSGEARYIDGLGATVVAVIDLELDSLTLREGPKTIGSDRCLVNEEIFTAVIRGDESEPFLSAEPLHRPR